MEKNISMIKSSPVQSAPHWTVFFLSRRHDRLRLLQLPTSLIPVVKDCVNNFWYLRMLKQREYHGTTELKLGGCPWDVDV